MVYDKMCSLKHSHTEFNEILLLHTLVSHSVSSSRESGKWTEGLEVKKTEIQVGEGKYE